VSRLPSVTADRSARWSAVLVAALMIAVQLGLYDRTFVELDEGHLLAVADRLLAGELLYRDVETAVFPGSYFVEAAIFAIFGTDVLHVRRAQVLLNAAIAAGLWLVARRVLRRPWSGLPPFLFATLVVVGFPAFTMFNYATLALAGAMATLLGVVRYLERGRAVDGALTGLALAVAALSKQSTGAFAALACLLTLLWARRRSPLADRSLVGLLAPVCAGGGALTLLAVAYFGLTGSLLDWLAGTSFGLVASQLRSYRLPYPPLLTAYPAGDPLFAFVYAPPALYAHAVHGGRILGLPVPLYALIRASYALPPLVLLLALALPIAARHADDTEWRAVLASAVFAVLLLLGIVPFTIWPHLAVALVPGLLLIALLADHGLRLCRQRAPRAARLWTIAWLAAVALAAAVVAVVGGGIRRWHDVPLGVPHASLRVPAGVAARHRAAVDFLRQCAGPEEAVFTAPILPQLYVLAGRRNATRYDLLIPGNIDVAHVLRALESQPVRCVVYSPIVIPGMPRLARSFPALARYLRDHYHRVGVFRGEGSVWYGLIRDPAAARP
jgi:hypothetical protein